METKSAPLAQRMTVLLADDDPQVCSAIRLILEQEAETEVIGEAVDGQSLFKLLSECCKGNNVPGGNAIQESEKEAQQFILLLDWELPDFKSLDQIPDLRTAYPGLIIVALSVQTEARQNALASGVDAFVSKSDPPDQVMAKLHALLR
jgi:DNA-binding NarL/FixJ family response regulator